MSAATSSSDRYEAARKALAEYDAHTEPRSLRDQRNREYRLASTLRALITPAAIDETPEQMAAAFEHRLYLRGTVEVLGGYEGTMRTSGVPARKLHAEAYRLGIEAGIQAAHESWEPENAPGMVDTRATEVVDFVFDRLPDTDGANFVEVETQARASTRVGEWLTRPDGYAVIRVEIVR